MNKLRFFLKQFYFKNIRYRKKGVILKSGVIFDSKVVFEGQNFIYQDTKVESAYIGLGTYIANNSVISRVKIGRFCSIGDNVRISLGMHPSNTFVSTHPAFFSVLKQAGFTFTREQLFQEHKYLNDNYCVEIGNDVWIGNNVTIFDGVRIGNGAIIGAGSIITKDVEDYSITLGVPGKHLKYRFSPEIVEKLLEFKWWDKDYNWIRENAPLFKDADTFFNSNKL